MITSVRRLTSAVLAAMLLFATVASIERASASASSWQVAGLVNLGEPTLRVVYDNDYPGARALAMQVVTSLRRDYSYLNQPGVITGLMQVGYSDHLGGVQIQLYGSDPYTDLRYFNWFESYGLNMTGCWENPSVCPTWSTDTYN